MEEVELVRVSVDLDGEPVLRDVSLAAGAGELLAIVGPSGSGKTTVLRVVAGLTAPTTGRVLIGGVDVTELGTRSRDLGMVFQEPALFPHRNVRRNVAFPLEIRHDEVAEIRRRVDAEVRALHIEDLLLRRPSELSRGEAQLVQIARAMVRAPGVLLLDEPFATLDRSLQHRMRAEIGILQRGYGVTTLMTTNDPEDVVSLPDRLAVIEGGRVVQIATRGEVHASPATLHAATSTGEMSTLPVTVEEADGRLWLGRGDRNDPHSFRLPVSNPGLADRVGEEVLLGVRPDDVRVADGGHLRVRVLRVVPGRPATAVCEVAGRTVAVSVVEPSFGAGAEIDLHIARSTLFDATSGYAIG